MGLRGTLKRMLSGRSARNLRADPQDGLHSEEDISSPTTDPRDESVTCFPEGWLLKTDPAGKRWQERWFTIGKSERALHYHLKKGGKRMGSISLADAQLHLGTADAACGASAPSPHTFRVITPTRVFFLCAHSEEGMAIWTNAALALLTPRMRKPRFKHFFKSCPRQQYRYRQSPPVFLAHFSSTQHLLRLFIIDHSLWVLRWFYFLTCLIRPPILPGKLSTVMLPSSITSAATSNDALPPAVDNNCNHDNDLVPPPTTPPPLLSNNTNEAVQLPPKVLSETETDCSKREDLLRDQTNDANHELSHSPPLSPVVPLPPAPQESSLPKEAKTFVSASREPVLTPAQVELLYRTLSYGASANEARQRTTIVSSAAHPNSVVYSDDEPKFERPEWNNYVQHESNTRWHRLQSLDGSSKLTHKDCSELRSNKQLQRSPKLPYSLSMKRPPELKVSAAFGSESSDFDMLQQRPNSIVALAREESSVLSNEISGTFAVEESDSCKVVNHEQGELNSSLNKATARTRSTSLAEGEARRQREAANRLQVQLARLATVRAAEEDLAAEAAVELEQKHVATEHVAICRPPQPAPLLRSEWLVLTDAYALAPGSEEQRAVRFLGDHHDENVYPPPGSDLGTFAKEQRALENKAAVLIQAAVRGMATRARLVVSISAVKHTTKPKQKRRRRRRKKAGGVHGRETGESLEIHASAGASSSATGVIQSTRRSTRRLPGVSRHLSPAEEELLLRFYELCEVDLGPAHPQGSLTLVKLLAAMRRWRAHCSGRLRRSFDIAIEVLRTTPTLDKRERISPEGFVKLTERSKGTPGTLLAPSLLELVGFMDSRGLLGDAADWNADDTSGGFRYSSLVVGAGAESSSSGHFIRSHRATPSRAKQLLSAREVRRLHCLFHDIALSCNATGRIPKTKLVAELVQRVRNSHEGTYAVELGWVQMTLSTAQERALNLIDTTNAGSLSVEDFTNFVEANRLSGGDVVADTLLELALRQAALSSASNSVGQRGKGGIAKTPKFHQNTQPGHSHRSGRNVERRWKNEATHPNNARWHRTNSMIKPPPSSYQMAPEPSLSDDMMAEQLQSWQKGLRVSPPKRRVVRPHHNNYQTKDSLPETRKLQSARRATAPAAHSQLSSNSKTSPHWHPHRATGPGDNRLIGTRLTSPSAEVKSNKRLIISPTHRSPSLKTPSLRSRLAYTPLKLPGSLKAAARARTKRAQELGPESEDASKDEESDDDTGYFAMRRARHNIDILD